MDLKLQGRAVLVTGGSRGIGRDIALGFAGEGARVAICGRDREQLETVRQELSRMGAQAFTVSADLAEPGECERVVNETADHFGRLDVLVNNASTSVDKAPSSLEDATDEQLLARIHGKTLVAMRCSRAALRHLRAAGGGRIVMIGGLLSRTVIRGAEAMAPGSGLPQGLGNASMANFAKCLSEELAADGINVNVVHPHFTKTGRYPSRLSQYARDRNISEAEAEAVLISHMPIGRLIVPQDITPLVLLLASALAGGITGQAVAVDGGAARNVIY